MHRPSVVTRLLALLLLLGSPGVVAPASLLARGCTAAPAQMDAAMPGMAGHHHAGPATAAVEPGAQVPCPHCPPTECATVAPCASAGPLAAVTPTTLRAGPRGVVVLATTHPDLPSVVPTILTPPPQRILVVHVA